MILKKINKSSDLKKLSLSELELLAKEVREFLLNNVSRTGGHLASNLGVVELTIALHYVFDFPEDQLIWDVGHQSYVHKILTGRKNKFDSLRKYKGLSGFPRPDESKYDTFIVGHSSTSLSLAAGSAVSRDLDKKNYNVLAIIGDGALTGGLAFEGLNNLGHLQKDVIVVLNTNEMSISPNVGAISYYINRIITGETYNLIKGKFERILLGIPAVGLKLFNIKNKIMEALKLILVPGVLFEELGFLYIGPENGHNLRTLIKTLKRIKRIKGRPILFHIRTKKGKGYIHAEKNPSKFHGISKFNIKTGLSFSLQANLSYTKVFSETLVRLAKKDKKIVAVTAAMPEGTGLELFQNKFSSRFFDVGIAEQHAVTFSAALAQCGYKPAVAIYSTFLQRAYDQLLHDVAIDKKPVKFFIDRAGIVGQDGETHQGIFDISYIRTVPGAVLLSPKDGREFMDMIYTAMNYSKGPIFVRYPRYNIPEKNLNLNRPLKMIKIGNIELLNRGSNTGIFTSGVLIQNVLQAANILKDKYKVNPYIYNIQCITPINEKQLIKYISGLKFVFILEENILNGGMGEYILSILNKYKINKHVKLIGIDNKFIEHGDPDLLRQKLNLSSNKIVSTIIKEIYGHKKKN